MSDTRKHQKAYEQRQNGITWQDPEFSGDRHGQQRKMWAVMKVKARRKDRSGLPDPEREPEAAAKPPKVRHR
jgi:hypothetical protein